jgi:hypothetical protein
LDAAFWVSVARSDDPKLRFSNDLWVSAHPYVGKLAVDENRRGSLFRTGPSSSVGMSPGGFDKAKFRLRERVGARDSAFASAAAAAASRMNCNARSPGGAALPL